MGTWDRYCSGTCSGVQSRRQLSRFVSGCQAGRLHAEYVLAKFLYPACLHVAAAPHGQARFGAMHVVGCITVDGVLLQKLTMSDDMSPVSCAEIYTTPGLAIMPLQHRCMQLGACSDGCCCRCCWVAPTAPMGVLWLHQLGRLYSFLSMHLRP